MTVDQARRRKALMRWHRRAGIFVLAWLVVLALSGVLINHAHDWGLDTAALPPALQQGFYGIESAGDSYCASYPDLGVECSAVFARLEVGSQSLLLAGHSLFLLDAEGALIERIPAVQLGLSSVQGGLYREGRILLRDHEAILSVDSDLLESVVLEGDEAAMTQNLDWTLPVAGEAISWERLLLDVHAARFLGPFSRLFNDLAAALILFLAVTGFWLYLHKRKNGAKS